MKDKEQKRQFLSLIIVMALGMCLLVGASYAFFRLSLSGTKENVLKAGNLSLVLNETSEGIFLTDALPKADSDGILLDPYTFTLTNNSSFKSNYTIYLDDTTLDTNKTRLDDSKIKYQLINNGTQLNLRLLSETGVNPNRILASGTIEGNGVYNFSLRLWIDQNATRDIVGHQFKGKLRIVASM